MFHLSNVIKVYDHLLLFSVSYAGQLLGIGKHFSLVRV